MDETEQLDRLDARGRRAAEGLRAEVARRPAPPFEPDLHRLAVDGPIGGGHAARRRWVAVVGMAAALALVAGVAALLSNGDEPGSTPADRVESGSGPRRMVAGSLPEGFEVMAVVELDGRDHDTAGDSGSPVAAVAWGPADGWPTVGAAIFADGHHWEDDVVLEAGAFGDRSGTRVPGSDVQTDSLAVGAPDSLLVEVDGREVVVWGVSAEPELLEQVAASLTVAGEEIDLPDGILPRGWTRSDVDPQGAPGLAASPPGWLAFYGPGSSDVLANLTVISGVGVLADARALALMTTDVEEVPLRGTVAVVASMLVPDSVVPAPDSLESQMVTVIWSERPGELLTVSASGLTRDEVLAVAEDVREADVSAWDELERQALLNEARGEAGAEGDGEAVQVAEGRFEDGSQWVLAALEEAGRPLRLALRASGGSGHEWSGAYDLGPEDGGRAFVAVEVGRGHDQQWAAGLVHDGVATVDVLDADGATLGEAEVVEGGGHRGFVLELPFGERDRAPEPLLPDGVPDLPLRGESGGVRELPGDWAPDPTDGTGEEAPIGPPAVEPPEVEPSEHQPDRLVLIARDASGAELARTEVFG